MRERVVVMAVDVEPAGDELAVDVTAGATTLEVKDTADFYEPEVDTTLTIGSETISYNNADPDTDIVALDTPLAGSYLEGEAVYLNAHTVVAKVRSIDGTGDQYTAIVPSGIIDQLDGAVYDLVRKVVTVEDDPDTNDVTVLWIDDELPDIDGTYINPSTIPAPGPDGDPPAVSPVATTRGGLGVVYVLFDGITNPDPPKYRLYAYTTSGTPTVADVLFEDCTPGVVPVRHLPDGSQLDYFVKDANGVETDEERLYYFRVQAYEDPDGDGPLGAEVSGSMDKAQGGDVAFNSVIGEHLAGVVVLGGRIVSPSPVGQRVEMSEGFQAWNSVPDLTARITNDGTPHFLSGLANLDSANIADGLNLAGGNSTLAPGGTFTLLGTPSTPQVMPTASMNTWPTVAISGDTIPTGKRGLYWDSGSGHWFFCVTAGGESTINERGTDGSNIAYYPIKNTTGGAIDVQGGLTRIGTTWYVLAKHSDGSFRVYSYPTITASTNTNAATVWTYNDDPSSPKRPTLGKNTAAGYLIIARATSGGVKIREYNTSGVQQTVVTSNNNPGLTDLVGIHRTTWLFGAERYVICPRSEGPSYEIIWSYTTGGTYQTNETWNIAAAATVAGFGYDGTNFKHIAESSSYLTTYTRNWWTTESTSWKARYTFGDSDSGGTGVHESPASSTRTFTAVKCARLVLTASSLPGGGGADSANRIYFYVGRGTVTNATTFRQTDPAPGLITGNYDEVTFTGDNLSSTDPNFPSAAASVFKDQSGTTILASDGQVAPVHSGMVIYTGVNVTGGGAIYKNAYVRGDGTAVSRTTGLFANLWAAVGSLWGSGDGSTTFNVFDGRNRFIIGAGSFKALGGDEGMIEANRTPFHFHTIPGGSHTHPISNTNHAGATNTQTTAGGADRVTDIGGTTGGQHGHGGNTQTDSAHNHTGQTGGTLGASDFPHSALVPLVKL